jgi:hypothetical protein
MASIVSDTDVQLFIGYFEEPEPGVPDGCTGWYHTSGKFPLRTADQVFTFGPDLRSPVRAEVAGPFVCRGEALEDLQACLGQ